MRRLSLFLALVGCTVEPARELATANGNDCVATAAPTIPATSTSMCDPLTQTGCQSGEKCAWIIDVKADEESDIESEGHAGCVPDGRVAQGCECTVGESIGRTYDDCAKGSGCIQDRCVTYCDPDAAITGCADGYACTLYASTFDADPEHRVGFCEPTCDPIRQEALVGDHRAACGSKYPWSPDRGCYGVEWFDTFTCAKAGDLDRVNRVPATEMPQDTLYANSCAPGFVPLFREQTGSMTVMCTGLCSPLDTDNTKWHNAAGNWFTAGKLPKLPIPVFGGATCNPGFKGTFGVPSDCVHLWPYMADWADPRKPEDQDYPAGIDSIGVCLPYNQFLYDRNGDNVPDTAYPSCGSLPPRTAQTTGDFDDAGDFGCYSRATMKSIPQPTELRAVGLPTSRAVRFGLPSLARSR